MTRLALGLVVWTLAVAAGSCREAVENPIVGSEDRSDADGSADTSVTPAPTGGACPKTLSAYCASAPCVLNWSEAQNVSTWCKAFQPNGFGVDIVPSCGALPYDVIEFGVGEDIVYSFYYAPDAGDLVQVSVSAGGDPYCLRCAGGSATASIGCNLACPMVASTTCPSAVSDASASDAAFLE